MKKLLILLLTLSFQSVFAQDIFEAARKNDITTIIQALEAGVKVDTVNNRGFSPLVLAIYNGNFESAKVLLEKGANPNIQDLSGNTALMGAIFKGLPKMADLLIDFKANLNQQNFNDATALIFSATFGQIEIAKKLIEKGADKNIKDARGKTALDHATMQENEGIIGLLK